MSDLSPHELAALETRLREALFARAATVTPDTLDPARIAALHSALGITGGAAAGASAGGSGSGSAGSGSAGSGGAGGSGAAGSAGPSNGDRKSVV